MTLEEAIARARDFDIWNADGGSLDIILQAAVDGDLIPSAGLFSSAKTYTEAEVKLAVALAYQRAAEMAREGQMIVAPEGVGQRRSLDSYRAQISTNILTLADTDTLAEVQKMRAALSTLNDKDMCQMGQAPCDWALRLIAEKEAAEARVAELEEMVKDYKTEMDWMRNRYEEY